MIELIQLDKNSNWTRIPIGEELQLHKDKDEVVE
jgi:hypothetical protein